MNGWTTHRIFSDAPEIVSRCREIDEVLIAVAGDPRVEANALRELFGGREPHWPAFDRDRNSICPPMKSGNFFSILAHAITMSCNIQRSLHLYEEVGVRLVRWMVGQCCAHCEALRDVIMPVGENFPGVDVPLPPAHVGCSCVASPADEEFSPRTRRLNREAARAHPGAPTP